MGSKIIFIAIVAVILFISAALLVLPDIFQNTDKPFVDSCIAACENYLKTGNTLDVGPCLMNPIPKTEWVCDVAHSPRMPIDNIAENQCSAFNVGTASHFIEVTPDCKFIRMF